MPRDRRRRRPRSPAESPRRNLSLRSARTASPRSGAGGSPPRRGGLAYPGVESPVARRSDCRRRTSMAQGYIPVAAAEGALATAHRASTGHEICSSLPPVYLLVRPLLFLLQPEIAHGLAGALLRAARPPRTVPEADPVLRQTLWGIDFPTPLGLAAGMDKGEVLAPAWFRLGFGWVEIGTITPRPQRGNERPRLFRLVPQRAIINRMGFNNAGAGAVASRLRRLPPLPGPVCVNVGRNKETPNERAAEDYVTAFRTLAPHAQLVCKLLYRSVSIPIVGVGGIFNAEDAYARIRAGASLVQVYTALVYEGPGLPRRISRGLAALLRRDGLSVAQAVGKDV